MDFFFFSKILFEQYFEQKMFKTFRRTNFISFNRVTFCSLNIILTSYVMEGMKTIFLSLKTKQNQFSFEINITKEE